MKVIENKVYWIFLVLVIFLFLYFLFYFFCPYYRGMAADGGTVVWEARLYTLVKWGEMNHSIDFEDGTVLRWNGRQGWEIYWYPNQKEYLSVSPMNMEEFPYEEYVNLARAHGKEPLYTNYEEFQEWEKNHPNSSDNMN